MKVCNHIRTSMTSVVENRARQEQLVYDALIKLGGDMHMRVMEFRKYIAEPMRETHVKEALRRLCAKNLIVQMNNKQDARGYAYKVLDRGTDDKLSVD